MIRYNGALSGWMLPLSYSTDLVPGVIIIAKNEERCLQRCLESVHKAAEIIVLDSGSTDATVEIARAYTDKVYLTDWQGYGIQKQRALEHATSQWLLNLDADETISEEFFAEMMAMIQSDKYDALRVPIRMSFYGKPLRFSASPERHVRIFKREGARYSNDIVHEKIILPEACRIGRMRTAITHDSYADLHHAVHKMNRYSSYSAKIRLEKHGMKRSLYGTIAAAFWMFIRTYILQLGFLDGRAGLVMALLQSEGAFYRHLKQVYPDRNLSQLPQVEN